MGHYLLEGVDVPTTNKGELHVVVRDLDGLGGKRANAIIAKRPAQEPGEGPATGERKASLSAAAKCCRVVQLCQLLG